MAVLVFVLADNASAMPLSEPTGVAASAIRQDPLVGFYTGVSESAKAKIASKLVYAGIGA